MKKETIEYNDIVGELEKKFPKFNLDKEEINLPYMIAGDFAVYLLECYNSESFDELQKGFNFIENLYLSGDSKIKELATIGFLEGIQNIWGNRKVDPENIFDILGKESQKQWKNLNKFWDKMPAINLK
ncbi:MAG: hypothetical protein KAT32_02590 [Candidatus Moranbacteria bacterium]|nr:hypothetical protein [Candidatus Moranbacteria bacterium]